MSSGEKAYPCDMFGCKMFPHFCRKILNDKRWRIRHQNGLGPTQIIARGDFTKKEIVLPSVREQARSFCEDGIHFIKDRCKLASKDHAEARFNICLECDSYITPENQPKSIWGKCTKCGCYCRLKSKGRVWTCPIGNWLEVDVIFNREEENCLSNVP